MNGVKIEKRETPLNRAEIAELARLYEAIFNGVYPDLKKSYDKCRETVLYWLAKTPQVYLVMAEDGRIAGFMLLCENELDQLYLDEAYRGRGLGSALVEIAKTAYPQGLSLYTLKQNEKAVAFYERHGFKVFEYGVAPDEGVADVLMEWRGGC